MIHANGKDVAWHPQMTVREVLKLIGYDFSNSLVRVDKLIIPQDRWDTHLVQDKADFEVHQIMSGG